MKFVRTLTVLTPVVMVAGLVTGCSTGSDSEATGVESVECTDSGSVSESIKVEGEFGSDSVTMTAETPLEVKKLERSVLIDSGNEEIASGDEVNLRVTEFNGVTGEALRNYETALQYFPESLPEWLVGTVACSAVGDRVLSVTTIDDVAGEGGGAAQGMEDGDAVVFVIDFLSKSPGTLEADELLEKAEGTAQEVPEGLPTVELDADGAPTITIPEGVEAPTELTIATLIQGDGEEVQEGDRVYVHYRGVIWRTGEEFDSSWSRGAPIDFLTTGVITGFSKALVGQNVGSQVMAVVPAEDGGYGADGLVSQGHEPDDVMVFVLDILGTVHAETA